MKCDLCNKPATVHLTEIRQGKKVEKHLCEQCAAQAPDLAQVKPHVPINELLTKFVMNQSQGGVEQTAKCEHCGITWAEFKQNGLLGCEHDYALFDRELTPLLTRAHEGATHHLGKVPAKRGQESAPLRRVKDATKLRKELERAVEAEDYEKAAKLRDELKKAEG